MENKKLKLAEAMAGITVMSADDAFKRGEITAKEAADQMFTEMSAFYAELDQFPADKNEAFWRFLSVVTRLNAWNIISIDAELADLSEIDVSTAEACLDGNRRAIALGERILDLRSTPGYAEPHGWSIEDRLEAADGHAFNFKSAWRDLVADASLNAEREAA